ncbi:uncharacterized protein LOC125233072 [Leguminivora glycinivorella]|uniref:uncharacterized protein LOC125233072 n=1 Tax=Leguminivora glycinivorella TaxID=1035111 RepID=UPI00200D148D|nr:uncharacterized protein LOC125233072 [Leguminivora glycinivorella]
MTKNKQPKSRTTKKFVKIVENKETENSEVPVKTDSLDDEDQGFGGWLKSEDGMDTMKLFVLANSIVMVTTIAYPHIQTIFSIISEIIYGEEEYYRVEL